MRDIPSIRTVRYGTRGPFYWQARHMSACESPATSAERAIVSLCDGITEYLSGQDGEDGVWIDYMLGPGLGSVLVGVRELLNGDIGRLDAGTVDSFLRDIAGRIAWDMDEEKLIYGGAS
jgi:hypothetical protein